MTLPVSKTLLNTGPSPRGWHRLELALRCGQLYAYQYVLGLKLPPTVPLIRGSLRHVGLAHLYARLRARQRGENEDRFYAPREAMQLAASELDREFNTDVGSKIALKHVDMPDNYVRCYGTEEKMFEILAVEEIHEAVVEGYRYTARFDLKVKDRNGRVFIIDHKGAARPDKRTVSSYSLSGQILGLARFGAGLYGANFGGVRLNFISGEEPPYRFERHAPAPAPAALERFPAVVRYAEECIAWIEKQPDPWRIPSAVFSDVVCLHRYGRCPGYSLCAWGPAGVPMLAVEDA